MGFIDIVLHTGEVAQESNSTNWSEIFSNGLISIAAAAIGGLIAWRIARYQIKAAEVSKQEETKLLIQKERDTEVQRIDERLSYFKWLIRRIIKLSDKQADSYISLSDDISNNNLKSNRLPTRTLADLERLNSVNLEDVFSSLIRKHGNGEQYQEHVRKLISHTDNINLILKEIPKIYQGMHTEIRDLKIEYREIIQSINSGFLKILHEMEKDSNYVRNPLWHFIDDKLTFYNTQMPDDSDVDWIHINYLYPLQLHLVKHFKSNDEMQLILHNGKKAILIAGQIKFSAITMAQQLKYYGESLKETVSELTTELEEFDKL